MPYINSKVTVKLSEQDKEEIKAKLGQIIAEIPGKSEEWLMLGFNDGETLYFRGKKMEKAAFVEVKIFGSTDRKYKSKVADLISSLYETKFNIPKDSIYIVFSEVEDWAWNGEMF